MHYFSGKGCSESLESMHYCIGILMLHPATEIQDYAQCGYTLYQIADICGLTPELVEYIITTYNRNDAASS